jgi:hypothetical protein
VSTVGNVSRMGRAQAEGRIELNQRFQAGIRRRGGG